MANVQKIQVAEWRSAEKGLVTAASDRDLPANALTFSENLLVDEVAGRLIVRDAWDHYPDAGSSRLDTLSSNFHKAWGVFEWLLVGAPTPIKVVVWTILVGEVYTLRLSSNPNYVSGTGWVDGWAPLKNQAGGGGHYTFGTVEPTSVQITRVVYEDAVRLFISYGTGTEDASANPIPPMHISLHEVLEGRFGLDVDAPAELVVEPGALLSHKKNPSAPLSQLIVTTQMIPGGGDIAEGRHYRVAMEYDGYQVGELSSAIVVEPGGGGDSTEFTLTIPDPGAFPRRPTGVLIFGAKSEDVLANEVSVGSYALVAKVDFVRGLLDVGLGGSSASRVVGSRLTAVVDEETIAPVVLFDVDWYATTAPGNEEYGRADGTYRGDNPPCGHLNQWSGDKWCNRTRVVVVSHVRSGGIEWALPANAHHRRYSDDNQEAGSIHMAQTRDQEPHLGGECPNIVDPLPWADGDGTEFGGAFEYATTPLEIDKEQWPKGRDTEGSDNLALGHVHLAAEHYNTPKFVVDGQEFREVIILQAYTLGEQWETRVGTKIMVLGRNEYGRAINDDLGRGYHTRFQERYGKEWPGQSEKEMFPVATIGAIEEKEWSEDPSKYRLWIGLEGGLSDDLDIPNRQFVYDPDHTRYNPLVTDSQVEVIFLEGMGRSPLSHYAKFHGCSFVTVGAPDHFPGKYTLYDPDAWALQVTWDSYAILEKDILAVASKRVFFRSEDLDVYAPLEGADPDFAKVLDLSGGGGYRGVEWNDGTISFVDAASSERLLENPLVHRPYSEYATHGAEIFHARGAIAARVGNRVFLADVRLPNPDAPHDTSQDESIRYQVIYSSFSETFPSVDSFPPANAFPVGEGTSRVVAMFEHSGRLVVLTETHAVMMQVQPGDFASVRVERNWPGLGGFGPQGVAQMQGGVAWLSPGGVYGLMGTEPVLLSSAINDRDFLKLIADYGATAELFYRPRRQTLHLTFPATPGGRIYTMSRNGAWGTDVIPVDALRSGESGAGGDALAIADKPTPSRPKGTYLLSANVESTSDLGDQPIVGVASFSTIQPAGGDRMARVVAANLEHSKNLPTSGSWLVAYVDGRVHAEELPVNSSTDRTRLNIADRGRNVQVLAAIRGRGNYLERASVEFIPKGRVRS